MILARLPTVNCPRINPKKKGSDRRYRRNPPYRSSSTLISHASISGIHTRFISQLPLTAKPSGWKGHQVKRVRIHCRKNEMSNPTPIASVAVILASVGICSQVLRRV